MDTYIAAEKTALAKASAQSRDQTARALANLGAVRSELLLPLQALLMTLLREAQEETSQKREMVFCWDWDIIRNYMFHDSPREPFGSVLKGMLEIESQGEGKVVILEGALKEMRQYLLDRARHYRLSRIFSESSNENFRSRIAAKGRSGESPWRPIEPAIEILLEDQGIRRLDEFLAEHATSITEIPINSRGITPAQIKETPAYSRALEALGSRYGNRRNRADAMNVAQISTAREEGIPSRLVTGTTELLRFFPDLTTDPFTSLISALIHVRLPQAELRVSTLNRWLTRVSELIEKFSTVQKVAEGSNKPLSANQLRPLISTLSRVQGEPVLLQLSDLLKNATLMCEIGSERVRPRTDATPLVSNLPSIRLRQLEASVARLLTTSLGNQASLTEIGLTWRLSSQEAGGYRCWEAFRGASKDAVISVEVQESLYSISWPVDLTTKEFLRSVENILHDNKIAAKVFSIEALYEDLSVESADIARGATLKVKNFDFLHLDQPLLRVRVITDLGVLYYEPGGVGIDEQPRAATVSRDPQFLWTLALNNETCSEFLPQTALNKDLRSYTGLRPS